MIFEAGFTGSAIRQRGPASHGLGLAFYRSVVKRHGGVIRVENIPEGGCRFRLFLPA